ncbi:protein Niban 1-like [Brachionichthys hirsutus]|uniref:protein Niban 1-like n=1 Tax=Brachionichthys hirsutus TaxID=412623 RepID=UPI0036043B83
MGISASSLLDETKSSYVRGQAEAALKDFSPYYRKQFSVAHFCQVEDDLEHREETMTRLLKQQPAPEEGEVLYEEGLFYFDETRKWRERYVVVRANYSLECHESLESFIKGVPPHQKLLPTGGAVLTTEEKYMAMVDQCFPGDTSLEDFAPPPAAMPGPFPVYLRLPYRRDSYFCFRQQHKQEAFISILSDCIRHQNQDFLKKTTFEVQAFLKAVQLYREDRGRYEAWDMLIGSDVRVMGNLVMERMLPSLEEDMLPRLKAKKTEKKRVWFATVEAAYILAQEHLLERLSALKDECRARTCRQEILIHSDMDQILKARGQLEDKVRAAVSAPAETLCSESIRPSLGAVLEELLGPVSAGFQEARQLSGVLMDDVCRDVLLQGDQEQLKKVLAAMARPNLQRCYQMMDSLQDKQQPDRFGLSGTTAVVQSAQIDLQQLMENAAFTFEQLLFKAFKDNPDDPDGAGSAINKAKHRVLKQFDHDSSTVRKRICRETLIFITLPFIKKNLETSCRPELRGLDRSVDADHSDFIQVENVYESVLLQTLDKEVSKAVKEAASLQKFNLFTDSRDLLGSSVSSPCPSPSTPSSAADVQGAEHGIQTVKEGVAPTSPLAEPVGQSDTHKGADEDLIQLGQPRTGAAPAEGSTKTGAEPPGPGSDPPNGGGDPSAGGGAEDRMVCGSGGTRFESPSSGDAPEDVGSVSDPDSLHVSVGSETAPSDLESTPGDERCEDQRSMTSDILEGEEDVSRSPVSSGGSARDGTDPDPDPDPQAQRGRPTSEPTKEETAPSPRAPPPDSIREIRDLVEEVIEMEALLRRSPSGAPKEE